jgi:hypothetical protein
MNLIKEAATEEEKINIISIIIEDKESKNGTIVNPNEEFGARQPLSFKLYQKTFKIIETGVKFQYFLIT